MIKWDDFDEESPNSRAHCQHCKKHIMKGQPRVGQMATYDRSPWIQWSHVACIKPEQAEQAVKDSIDALGQAYKVLQIRKEMEAANAH
jgi:hypothetical protein